MNKYQIIEKKSITFRNINGISSSASINLKSLLIKLGVTSYFKPMSSDFSGMALKCDTDRFMLINTRLNLGRQNFTIGHELYHLFIQENFTSETTLKAGQFNSFDPEEYKADLFASFFLMPTEGIYEIVPDKEIENFKKSISLDTVIKLEQYFQVSRSAMLYRLLNLGLVKEKDMPEYRRNVINSAARRGHDDKLYKETNQSKFLGDYGDLAHHLMENEMISEGDYYSLMKDIDIDVMMLKQNTEADD